MSYLIYLIPVLNALFGWFTVTVIIYFVFHPLQKKNLLLFRVQGLLPSLQQSIAEEAAEYISNELVNFKVLEEKLLSPDSLKNIHDYLDKKAEEFLRIKLPEKLPMLSMFITDSLVNAAKESLVGELDKMIPEIIKMYSGKIQEQFDVKTKVKEFILTYPVTELEKKIYSKAGKKILKLKILVAFVGFTLGVAELGILYFLIWTFFHSFNG